MNEQTYRLLFARKILNDHCMFLCRYRKLTLRRIGQIEVVPAADRLFIPVARDERLFFETNVYARGIVHYKTSALLQRVPVLPEAGRIFIRDERFLFVRRHIHHHARHNAGILAPQSCNASPSPWHFLSCLPIFRRSAISYFSLFIHGRAARSSSSRSISPYRMDNITFYFSVNFEKLFCLSFQKRAALA